MMMSHQHQNGHVILASRPGEDNEPCERNFDYVEIPYPEEPPGEGHVLIRNIFLSVDPALRCRMNDDTGVEYMKAWEVGKTISGVGGLGEVVLSADPNFQEGELVLPIFEWPWQKYFVTSTECLKKIPEGMSKVPASLFLSLLGLTGLTAYLGVINRGHVTPEKNQTMVVSAAAGSTGSFAGQIAKAEGCGLVMGICGGDSKCKVLLDEFNFDAAINYRTENVSEKLREICPNGVDIYFDNVGGDISNDVIQQMNQDGHVILCGQIAVYNKNVPYPPPIPDAISAIIKEKNITRERYLVLQYKDQFNSALLKLTELYTVGKIKVKETIEKGLENSGKAFVSMMKGGNLGKQIVQVSEIRLQ